MKLRYLTPLALIGALLIHSTPVAAAAPAVFFVPHQDDDLITMGAAIVNHVRAGRNVYVVQVTDGTGSGARIPVANALDARGYKTAAASMRSGLLTFSEARDREQRAALIRMGVRADHIIRESVYRYKSTDTLYFADGRETYDKNLALFRKYAADPRFVGASFKTMSWLDMLGDHYRLGYAMNTLCLQGVIRDCRFYQSPLYQSVSGIRAKTSTGATIPGIATPAGQIEKSSSTAAITAAANEYRLWAPASGRYAIGGKYSVKSQIDYTVRYPQSKSHRDSRNFLSSTDRARANTWAKTYQGAGYRAF